MSYTPTEWNCGDTITADKMNKIEQGIADCCGGGAEPLEVTIRAIYDEAEDITTYTSDMTYEDIYDWMGTRNPYRPNENTDVYYNSFECIVTVVNDGGFSEIRHGYLSTYLDSHGTGGYALVIYDHTDPDIENQKIRRTYSFYGLDTNSNIEYHEAYIEIPALFD